MLTVARVRRSGALRLVASMAAISAVATGCGDLAENLVEEGVEQAIEAESGEEFELDFNGEDGMRIETDEGTMTIDEDGNFVIEGPDGEVITGETSEDGVTVTNEDGDEVLTIDEEDGVITSETEDGSFTAGPGVPDDWPASVPTPEGLSDANGSSVTGGGEVLISVSGSPDGSAVDYFDSYESRLEGAGYARSSYFESDGIRQGTYEGSDFTVTLVGDDGSSNIAVTIISSNS